MIWSGRAIVAAAMQRSQPAVLSLGLLLLVGVNSGCRGLVPAPRAAVATATPGIAAAPAPPRAGVTVYIVTSEEQANLVRGTVSAANDAHGRHDVVLIVGPTQTLVVNAAGLRGGLPSVRVIDLQPHPSLPVQSGGSAAAASSDDSP